MNEFQTTTIQLTGKVLEPYGFALGGAQALKALGITQRDTQDIDTFTSSFDPDLYAAAEKAVINILTIHGYETDVTERDSFFRGIKVTDPVSREIIRFDLNPIDKPRKFIQIPNIGPVLNVEDLLEHKIIALVNRMQICSLS